MAIKIGLNLHPALQGGNGKPRAYSAAEKSKRDGIIDRLQSTGNLFMDDPDTARACKKRHPGMIVVHRKYASDDGQFYKQHPQAFYDAYARYGEGGLVVQALNEPTGYGSQGSPEDLEKIAEWCARVMDLFGHAGYALALPNFGEGHPHEVRLGELAALWEGLKKWKDLHFYASHEYGTWRGMTYDDPENKADVYPWRVGRFKFIADYCEKNHGFIPNMLITEWGIDSAHDGQPFRGWRTTGRTGKQYAQELIAALKKAYHFAYIKALMTYSMGNTGERHTESDWWSFDVWNADDFFDELEVESNAAPAPEPPPIYPPLPFGSDPRFKKWVNESGDNYRIRPYPSLQHAESDWINTDEAFDYLLELTVENWVVVKSLSGIIGWSDRGVLAKKLPTPLPSPEPDEEPPPPPPVDYAAAAAKQMQALNASIAGLQRCLETEDEEIKKLSDELSERSHYRDRLHSSIELQRLTVAWLEATFVQVEMA